MVATQTGGGDVYGGNSDRWHDGVGYVVVLWNGMMSTTQLVLVDSCWASKRRVLYENSKFPSSG